MFQEYLKIYLLRLKIILQSNCFYAITIILLSIYVILFSKVIKYETKYKEETSFEGIVTRYTQKEDKTTIYLKAKEKILVNIYDKFDISVGDKIKVKGNISDILPNTIPNTFNYKKYLYNNHIYTKVVASDIEVVSHSNNIFVKAKNFIINRVKGNTYLMLFICGDKTGMDASIYNNFKDCGIAHLLAISGMHVSIFIMILNKILFFLQKNLKNIIIIAFLLFYCYLVNFTPSILRVVISFIIGILLDKVNIRLSSTKRLLLTAFVIILIDPFNVYSTSFQYSFSAALAVISSENRQKKNYFINIIIISFYTLLFTLPITINLNYECNLILFVSNLVFIPFVSFFLYPLGLLTFIFPILTNVFNFFSQIMEKVINLINRVDLFGINIPRLSWLVIIIFYIFIYIYLRFNKKKILFLIISLIIMVKINSRLDFNNTVIFFDVGQGDSAAIITKFHKSVTLIDTGGLNNYLVSDNVILYFKSIGVTKIDTLLLSHGDYDHMGDAVNIIDNIKVKKVIFNKGNINDLENNLIQNLNEKKVPYLQGVEKLEIDNAIIYSLNNKIYDNENDNSNVVLIELDNKKFLFMGDASSIVENDILNNNLQNITVLKVGHHGSKTSSARAFIERIKPIYAVISVGRNNRYHHPNQSVINILQDSKIYRTDQDGTIIFKFDKNNLKIKTNSIYG